MIYTTVKNTQVGNRSTKCTVNLIIKKHKKNNYATVGGLGLLGSDVKNT